LATFSIGSYRETCRGEETSGFVTNSSFSTWIRELAFEVFLDLFLNILDIFLPFLLFIKLTRLMESLFFVVTGGSHSSEETTISLEASKET